MGGMRAEEQEEATRRAPPCRRSLLTKRRTPPRRHCRRINCRDGRWTCGSADAPQGLDGFGQRDRYMYVCVGAYLLSGASVGRREMDVRIRNAPQGLDGLGQSQRVRSPSQINKYDIDGTHELRRPARTRPDHRREDSDDLRRLAALPSPSRFAPPASLYQALPAVRFATPVMRGGHTSATPLPPPMHTS
jgi:hypothetical protein